MKEQIELEAKFKVKDWLEYKKHLRTILGGCKSSKKKDFYYKTPDAEYRIRKLKVRFESVEEKYFLTSKMREEFRGLEKNIKKEEEFVSFEKALNKLTTLHPDARPYSYKEKKTFLFTGAGIQVEASIVEDLGDFLEFEVLLPKDTTKEELEAGYNRIIQHVELLGLKIKDNDKESYQELFKKLSQKEIKASDPEPVDKDWELPGIVYRLYFEVFSYLVIFTFTVISLYFGVFILF